jgi:hypothetical protein
MLRSFVGSAPQPVFLRSNQKYAVGGHVERGGEKRHTNRVLGREMKESSDLDDLGVNASII